MKQLKMFLTLLFISIICFIPKTYAASLWNWVEGNDILQTDYLRYGSNCQNGSCTDWSKVNGFDYSADTGFFVNSGPVDLYTTKQYYSIDDVSFNNNSEKDIIIFRPAHNFVPNYSYALSVYMCSSSDNGIRIRGVYTSDTYGNLYDLAGEGTILASGFNVLNNRPFNNQQETIFKTCRKMTVSFSTSSPGAYIGLTINNGSSSMPKQDLFFFGYKITELGYTNFSTQEDVNTIKQAVNQTNQELDGVKDEIGQTNEKLDTIVDTSSPDLNGLSNANTWLPQGPVDSIIMLPLNFINTLIGKIGSTCTPIKLPLPFLNNKFLTLPCISTLFEQINGFSTLYNLIGVIGSVYLLYNYFLKFYKWIDDTLSFRENNWQDWGGV